MQHNFNFQLMNSRSSAKFHCQKVEEEHNISWYIPVSLLQSPLDNKVIVICALHTFERAPKWGDLFWEQFHKTFLSSTINILSQHIAKYFVDVSYETWSSCIFTMNQMKFCERVYFLSVYLCISLVCICVFANKGEVGPSVQCLNSNEWWGGGYPPHPSMHARRG